MRVLVVEDDPSVRETVGMVLEAYQHQPDLVCDGEEALEYLRHQWPDVMLLDLSLPGISGEQVYERIGIEFGRTPPTVVLSAASQGILRTREMAGTWYLAKPYTIEELAEALSLAATASKGAA